LFGAWQASEDTGMADILMGRNEVIANATLKRVVSSIVRLF
jgi:hypothetical protein